MELWDQGVERGRENIPYSEGSSGDIVTLVEEAVNKS